MALVLSALAAPASAQALKADFTCSPSCSAVAGGTVTFNATSDASKPIYSWDLDGDSPPVFDDASGPQALQTFPKQGTFPIELQVEDSGTKQSVVVTHNVTVSAPTVDFTCSPSCTIDAGRTIKFEATSDAASPNYAWNLKGESPPTYADATGPTASRAFSTPGTYSIAVRMTDAASGLSATATQTVTVNATGRHNGWPIHIHLPAGGVSTGAASSLGARAAPPAGIHVVAYHWRLRRRGHFDVDTGSISTLIHHFGPGSYRVSVQAVGSDGSRSATSTASFNVAPSPSCRGDLTFGWIEIVAPGCIRYQPGPGGGPGTYTVNVPARGISLNGLSVECALTAVQVLHHETCSLTIRPTAAVRDPLNGLDDGSTFYLRTDHSVRIRMLNTPDGALTLGTDQLAFTWTDPHGLAEVPFDSVSLPRGEQFGYVPISGRANIALTSDFGVHVTFNTTFTLFGHAHTQPVSLTGSNRSDMATAPGDWSIDLSGLLVPPLVDFPTLRLSYQDHMAAFPGYTGPPLDHVFTADATADILLTGWVFEAGVVVRDDFPIYIHFSYDSGSGGITNPGAPPSGPPPSFVPTGVGLDSADATLRSQPYFEVGGHLVMDLGGYKVGGGLHYAEAHLDDQGHQVPFQLFLDGQVPILIPGLTIDVGVYVTGDPTPGFGASGTLSYDIPPVLNIDAGIYLYVSWGTPNEMEFGAHGTFQVLGITLAEARGFMNQDWAAGCGSVVGIPAWGLVSLNSATGPAPAGGLGGCDNIAPYSDCPELAGLSRAGSPAAQHDNLMDVPKGLSVANLSLSSSTGTPRVHITGPGVNYTTPAADGPSRSGNVVAIVSGAAHHVTVGVLHPRAGRYKIIPVSGSPSLTRVQDSLPRPTVVRATVSGHGPARVLNYMVNRVHGQTVTFIERTKHGSAVIGRVRTGGMGTFRFRPGTFAGRRRSIIALPTIDGMPRAARVVAAYTAPGAGRPGAPHRLVLRVNRRTDSVLASWSKVPGALRYQVTVTATDGRRLTVLIRHPRLRIPSVFPGTILHVSVRSQGGLLTFSRASRATLRRAPRKRTPPRSLRRH